jgi:hypothetical protein
MMRRLTLIVGLALCISCASIAASALASEWTAPTTVPGVREAVLSRVAVSRYDAVAIASDSGYVAVRFPEGRWARVRKLAGSDTIVSSPDIAFDARGRLLLTWARASGRPGHGYSGPYEVMAQTWTEAGGWGPVRELGPAEAFILAQPRIAVDSHGDAIVAWRGYRRAGKRTAEAVSTSFRPADRGWEPMQQLPGGGPYRDVTLDAKGNAYAVWTTYAGPRNYFSMRPRGTGRWGSARRLPGLPASVPTVAVNPSGTAVVAWRAAIVDSEGEGIQYGPPRAIMRTASGRWSKVRVLSSTHVHDVRAAVSPTTGTILLTWAPQPEYGPHPVPGGADMHFAVVSPTGAIGPERRAPGSIAGPVAYRPGGDAIVVFGLGGAATGEQRSIRFAALVSREPTFSEPVTIVAHGSYPSLATPPSSVGPIEAAMASYQEAGKRLELSLLTRGPLEPHP